MRGTAAAVSLEFEDIARRLIAIERERIALLHLDLAVGKSADAQFRALEIGDDGRLGIGGLTEAQVELVESRLLGLDLDPLDTSDGVRLAARYLRYVQDRTHTERDALVAFRQGLSSFLDDGAKSSAESFADEVLAIRDQRS